MIELNKFMKYKIDDKTSYKILNIKILKYEKDIEEKDDIIEFMKKHINNLDIKYKIIIDFSCIKNIELDNVKRILNLYEDQYKSMINDNILLIICIIPNVIISSAIKIFLYFNDLGIPITIVASDLLAIQALENIDDANDISDD